MSDQEDWPRGATGHVSATQALLINIVAATVVVLLFAATLLILIFIASIL